MTLANLLKPNVNGAALLLRLGLAAIFIVHGWFKIYVESQLLDKMSVGVQVVVGWVELICGFLLALGLLSRLATLPLIIEQIVAIVVVTWPRALQGPMITRTGADYTKVGPEFNIVLIMMCLSVILLGSGKLSVDHYLKTFFSPKAVTPTAVSSAKAASGVAANA